MDEDQLIDSIRAHLPTQLTDSQVHKCAAYLQALAHWNKRFNLTAIRDIEDMVALHLYDSLSVLPYLKPGNLLDVGTGAGLPGIIIAIMQPDREIALLDSNNKKTRFLIQMVSTLQLPNVQVYHQRIEQHQHDGGYNNIVSRAFSELSLLVGCSKHLLSQHGQWVAMKGVYPQAELEQLAPEVQVTDVSSVSVPKIEAQRHVVVLRHQQQ